VAVEMDDRYRTEVPMCRSESGKCGGVIAAKCEDTWDRCDVRSISRAGGDDLKTSLAGLRMRRSLNCAEFT